MTDIDHTDFDEVLSRFEHWRQLAAQFGAKPYDAPDFEDGRLNFRVDYADQVAKWPAAREQGDWGALIIESTTGGLFNVVQSLWHERAPKRQESLEAVFSRAEDAGKYVISRVANGIRVRVGLDSLAITWEEEGLGNEVTRSVPTDQDLTEFAMRNPRLTFDKLREFPAKYRLVAQPEICAIALNRIEPYMHILTLTFDQLDALLEGGLPPTRGT